MKLRMCSAAILLTILTVHGAALPLPCAEFVMPPEIFLHHTVDRAFVGPGTFQLKNGDVIMAAPWGRPPVNFEELARTFPVPPLYRSKDHGRTWEAEGSSWSGKSRV